MMEQQYRKIIQDLLKLASELDGQTEASKKELDLYIKLLNNKGSLKNLPSKMVEIALGTLVLLSKGYKNL